MSQWSFEGLDIVPGSAWSVDVALDTPICPSGARFSADVKRQPDHPVITTLSTDNGGITRIGDYELALSMTADQTSLCPPDYVRFDVVRIDVTPAIPAGLSFAVPVKQLTTRV